MTDRISPSVRRFLAWLVDQPADEWATPPWAFSPRNVVLRSLKRWGELEIREGRVRLTAVGRDKLFLLLDVEGLPKSERFLMKWLAKEDVSRLGECKGAPLDHLVKLGFAEILGDPNDDHSGVRLTGQIPRAMAARLDDLGGVVA